jgi:hypothetical protein
MITLIPIEPLSPSHGALIVAAFSRLLIDAGGQPDGWGYGDGGGWGGGDGGGWGYGRGYGYGNGNGGGDGVDEDCDGKIPDEWRVE